MKQTLVHYFQKRSKPNGAFKMKGIKPTEIKLHLPSSRGKKNSFHNNMHNFA